MMGIASSRSRQLGDAIDYCPDGVAGARCLDAPHRLSEQIKDPAANVKRSLSRVYNQLSS